MKILRFSYIRYLPLILLVILLSFYLNRGYADPWPFEPSNQAHPVNTNFGQYQHYPNWEARPYPHFHRGVDIEKGIGEPIYAIAEGRVLDIKNPDDLTHQTTEVWVGNDWANAYGYVHIDPNVNEEEEINIGTHLGDVVLWLGFPIPLFNHLHLEIYQNGGKINPLSILQPNGDDEAPTISAFYFYENENGEYISKPGSGDWAIHGDIDVIVDAYDVISPGWDYVNPYEIKYWIDGPGDYDIGQKTLVTFDSLPSDDCIHVVYRNDSTCDSGNNKFYFIVTNTNGDGDVEISDAGEYWNTNEKNSIEIDPDMKPKYPDGIYRVFVQAKDIAGLTAMAWQEVRVDNPPTMFYSQIQPPIGATGVLPSTSVSITFSEPMDKTATENAFSLSPSVSGTFSWDGDGDTMTFEPDSNLGYGTTYTVTITSEAKDLTGNALDGLSSGWSGPDSNSWTLTTCQSVCGDVSGTWTADNSPYIVTGNITVSTGSSLTIEPGVEIRFDGHYSLTVNGLLTAVGTEANSIRFTNDDHETGWGGIRFINAGDNSRLEYCIIEYGRNERGGGIYCYASGGNTCFPTITNCTISQNTVTAQGGGIYCYAGDECSICSPTITNCTISNNSVGTTETIGCGGAVYCCASNGGYDRGTCAPNISNNTLTQNSGPGTVYGGAIYHFGGGATIANNTISENSASLGAGIYVYRHGGFAEVIIENNAITNNTGTGIHTCGDSGSIVRYNTITNNTGYGVWDDAWSTTQIFENTISGNSGGIRCGHYTHSYASIIGNTITNNSGAGEGAGICLWAYSHCTSIERNIIRGNSATNGGGIFSSEASPSIINNLIVANSATNRGGGILLGGSSCSAIINNTIANNSADSCGGGICTQNNASPKIINNILYFNTALDGAQLKVLWASSAVVSYSNIQGGWEGTGNIDINPSFGNPTSGLEYDLGPGSPCLNTGTIEWTYNDITYYAPDTDIEGRQRPAGSGVDIGAYEQNDEATLAVELSAFTATASADGVILCWRTESEVNNVGFAIYRSGEKDGQYTEIGWVRGAGNSAMSHDYQFFDKKVEVGKTYFYYIEDVDIAGERDKSDIIQIMVTPQSRLQVVIPAKFALLQNYPNPFNPVTWLPYELALASYVTIHIYNTKGQLIRIINIGNQKAGIYTTKGRAAYWDGRDSLGRKVASGVYFYTLQAGKFRATRRMVIAK